MRLAFSCGAALQGPQRGHRRLVPWGIPGRWPCGGGPGEVQGELGVGRRLPQQTGLGAESWGGHGEPLPATTGGNALPTPLTLPVVTLPGHQAKVLGPHGRPVEEQGEPLRKPGLFLKLDGAARGGRERCPGGLRGGERVQRETPTTPGSLWGPRVAAPSAADRAASV